MKPFIEANELVVLGVIQEQHAERCRLFRQWKQLDFPIVHDPLNTLGITVVPVYLGIDEFGIVRRRPRKPAGFHEQFVQQEFPIPADSAPVADLQHTSTGYWRTQQQQTPTIANQLRLADSVILWDGRQPAVQQALDLYEQASRRRPERSDIHFRLGVAARRLYELEQQTSADRFAQAVAAWETALRLNPNHYIYRRRIEQYGPRLKKPYSFYDWVANARQDISDRDDIPLPLAVEPNGAELAQRARTMPVAEDVENPDPQNRIVRDRDFAMVHVTSVPSSPKPGDMVAVHVGFSITKTAKWNHETSPLTLWIRPPADGAVLSSQLIRDETNYTAEESVAPVSLSFELQILQGQTEDIQLEAFALFNLCEASGGQCLYRRKDITIHVPVATN